MAARSLPLIYIASTGRSGSTVLELVLNTKEPIWSLGELYALPWEVELGRPCGCGAAFHCCPFWSRLIPPLSDSVHRQAISRFREYPEGGPFFRLRHMKDILLHLPISGADDKKFQLFCKENRRLINEAYRMARVFRPKVQWLIDASKDFYRLHFLSLCPSIDLKVIHMVRDPRAYVHSTTKNLGGSIGSLRYRLFRMSWKYILENLMIASITSRMENKRTFFLRYEDLATQPEPSIAAICRWLGVREGEGVAKRFRQTVNHAVAGNMTRAQNSPIVLDEKWKTEMTPLHQKLVYWITGPVAKRYGY